MVDNSSALQRVNDAVFYHLHKSGFHDDQWFAGNEITFDGKNLNPYYYNCAFFKADFRLYGQNHPLQALSALTEELTRTNYPLEITELVTLPARLSAIITELTVALREEVFEDVRKTQFPDRPSRKTCLFVCDKSKIKSWKDELGATSVSPFRLSLTGTIFRTNARYVDLNEYGTNYYRECAVKYWQGVQGDNNDYEEILFHGKAKILPL